MGEYTSLYRQTLLERQRLYNASTTSGKYSPFIYPWDSLSALWLFLSMILAQRVPERFSRPVRYAGFTVTVGHSIWVAVNCRTMNFAGGFGIGLMVAYGSIMAATLLLCNDVRKDFVRLEVRKTQASSADASNGSLTKDNDTRRYVEKRTVYGIYGLASTRHTEDDKPGTDHYHLVWQPAPHTFTHLLIWTIDLMTAIRGVNWNYRVSPLPPVVAPHPAPPSDKVRFSPSASKGTHSTRSTSVPAQTLKTMRRLAIRDFLIFLFLLDTFKTIAITDPFFLGIAPITSPSPWSWLRTFTTVLPIATKAMRLIFTLAGVIIALSILFSLSPLFFLVILPPIIDPMTLTHDAPMLEPSMYPPYWLPLTSVLDSGLPGFWGKFWHQVFRFSISEPARVGVAQLGLNPKSQLARVLQLIIAFTLSGTIHGMASYTSFHTVQSHPLKALGFFVLQALGCMLQDGFIRAWQTEFPAIKRAPRLWKRIGNGLFVLVWLYFTGPILATEFAQAGAWLYEPLPFSLWRGLGFGPGGRDEGWWCWSQRGRREFGWSDGGGRWWRRGVAVY